MTVRFPRWYGVPPELFELGHFAELSDGAVRLYCCLCWISDRRSSRMFELEDGEMVKMVGVSRRTLSDARKNLSRRGLVVCDRQPGGRYTYILCNLVTGRPFPGDPRAKVSYEKKPSSQAAEPTDETPAEHSDDAAPAFQDTASSEATRAEGTDSCDTDFPFGCNRTAPQPTICASDYNPFLDRTDKQFLQDPPSKNRVLL